MSSAEGEPIRVLHVDDDPELAEVVGIHLERQHEDMRVATEQNADAGLKRLARDDVDCVVSDHDMPEKNGLEFLRSVRDVYPGLPFILFTGKGNEEIASDAISAGVTEYLQKGTGTDQYAVLANRIERAVAANRAKSALEESERMLSTLISNLPGMVYQCENERGWPMKFVSDGARDLTGYSPDEIEDGEIVWGADVIREADRDGTWKRVQTAIGADEPFEVTYRIETKDGETRWLWERGRIVDTCGAGEIIEGFVTDITARKARERELQAEREFTENVVNALDDVFYLVNLDGKFVRWNDRLNEITGYGDAEISEMTALDFFPEEYHDVVEQSTADAIMEGTTRFEAEFETKAGDRLPVEFRGTPLYDSTGDLIGISGVGRDVSQRKSRERELERYETIIQAVGDPVYTLDEDGVFTFVNGAMETLSGYECSELVGEHISTVMVDEDVETGECIISDLLGNEDAIYETFEMDVVSSEGDHVPCENHVALLPVEDDQFRGTAGVIRDIGERKAREHRLEEFASVVSHDLRNPLNVVQGRVQLALDSDEVENLDAALDAAERMERLIDDLLRLAQQGRDPEEVEPVDVADVATDAWDNLAAAGSTLTVETTRTVDADPDRFCELFENLFRNSVERGSTGPRSQTPENTVDRDATSRRSSSTRDDTAGAVSLRVGDTESGFFVADDGVGIDPDVREKVFDGGYSTTTEGTGFGLAIVESIVTAHGWAISVTDGPDGGVRFDIDV